jgi:hypothetical protein
VATAFFFSSDGLSSLKIISTKGSFTDVLLLGSFVICGCDSVGLIVSNGILVSISISSFDCIEGSSSVVTF